MPWVGIELQRYNIFHIREAPWSSVDKHFCLLSKSCHATLGFQAQLYGRLDTPLDLEVRLIKVERVENLVHGCRTWTQYYAKLRTIQRDDLLLLLLRTGIGFRRKKNTNHKRSYRAALEINRCVSVETTVRKRRLSFAGTIV